MNINNLDEILENICDNYCLHSCFLESEDDEQCENCPLDDIRNLFVGMEAERDKAEIKSKVLYKSLLVAKGKLIAATRPKVVPEDKHED